MHTVDCTCWVFFFLPLSTATLPPDTGAKVTPPFCAPGPPCMIMLGEGMYLVSWGAKQGSEGFHHYPERSTTEK